MKRRAKYQGETLTPASLDAMLLRTELSGHLVKSDDFLPFEHLDEISADLICLLSGKSPYSLDIRYGEKTYRVKGKKHGRLVDWHFTDISDLLDGNSSGRSGHFNSTEPGFCHFAHAAPGSGQYPQCLIAKNELNLRLVLEESNQYIAVFDEELVLAYCNRHYAQAVYDHEGIYPRVGEPVLDRLNDEQRKYWLGWFERVMQGNEVSFEAAYRGNKGELIYLDNYLKPLLIDGCIRGIIQFTTNITEKKRLDQQLVETEERLRMATEAAHIGVFDWREKEQELIWDQRLQEMFSGDRHHFTEELKNRVNCQQHQDSISYDNPYFNFESVIPVDGAFKYIESYGRIVYDKNGQAERIIGISLDFTDYRRTEAFYRESKINLRAIFDSSTNAHYLIDKNFKLLSFNRVGSEFIKDVFGIQPSDGDHFLDYVLPAQKEGFTSQFKKAFKEENIQRLIEIDVPGKGIRWFTAKFKPAYYEDKIIGVIFSANDITEQVAAEKKNQRLLNIICDSPTEVYLINQHDFTIEFVNEEVISNVQWRSEQLKQKKFYDLQPKMGREGFRQIMYRLEKNHRRKIQYKTQQLRQDGSEYSVEVYLQRAGDASESSLLAFVVDITETEKIQSNLRDIEQNYKLLIDNIPGFVTLLDAYGNVLFKNQPNSGQLTEPGIQFDFILDECREKGFNQSLKRTVSTQQVGQFESQICIDAQTIWFVHQLVPIIKDKSVGNVMMISTNITPQKNHELQLRHSIDEKDVLLKEIHHRVKNNLQIISSILYLKSSQLDDPQSRQVMEECNQRIRSMHMIHEQLLREQDLSNIDSSMFLEKLITQVYQSFRLPEKEIELECDIAQIQIGANKVMSIAMIIYELLSNAMLHAFTDREKGIVTIKLGSSPACVNLCVCDDGRGMPANENWQDSLGILLVKTFAAQIKANLEINSGKQGTHFCIQFND
jgi:PAS domain S-box-containing protein